MTDYEYLEFEAGGGRVLRYARVLPKDFQASESYPVLLALPPGGQDQDMVEAGLDRYWGEYAAAKGWVVISPIAPAGELFFTGAESLLEPLVDQLQQSYHMEGGLLHLAGVSNGGRSAFRLAGLHPESFQSLTSLPGFPPSAEDQARLVALHDLTITMYAGGDDSRWAQATRATAKRLAELGADVSFTIFPGEGHVPASLDGGVLMNRLEKVRTIRRIHALLDDFHEAAAAADGPRYFAHFAPGAVFLGTDPGERWSLESFREFASPYFERGQGWSYRPTERHVSLAGDSQLAYFDERLDNESYGVCRSTGVCLWIDGHWSIAQYSLSIPIPNELTADLVARIRAAGQERK